MAERRDARSSFLLGVAFSFAACPTLFVLFFGSLIPLAVAASVGGLTFPAIFAIGTAFPLMLFVALLAFGAQSVTPMVRKLRTADVWVSRMTAIVFIIVGVELARLIADGRYPDSSTPARDYAPDPSHLCSRCPTISAAVIAISAQHLWTGEGSGMKLIIRGRERTSLGRS